MSAGGVDGFAGSSRVEQHAINPDRLGDVLDPLLPQIGVADLDLGPALVIGRAGDGYAARGGQLLQALGDVHAIAMDVVSLKDHVAEIDADAIDKAPGLLNPDIAFRFKPLDFHRAAQRIDDTVELDQQGIAHGLHEAAVMRRDRRLEDLTQVGLEAGARSLLVGLTQADIANDIHNEDSGKSAVHTRISPSPAKRRPRANAS